MKDKELKDKLIKVHSLLLKRQYKNARLSLGTLIYCIEEKEEKIESEREEKESYKLGDFDIWYKPCDRCGYDTAKSRKLNDARCWKCGNIIHRDYSKRALKL